jgi:hypothetical protein
MENKGNQYKGKNWICMPQHGPMGGWGGGGVRPVVATANIRSLTRRIQLCLLLFFWNLLFLASEITWILSVTRIRFWQPISDGSLVIKVFHLPCFLSERIAFLHPRTLKFIFHIKQKTFTRSHSYLITYSMQQCSSWETNRFSANQEIPAFYRNQKFITAFTSVRHLSLSRARSIQSMHYPHSISWRFILILSSHLSLSLSSGPFLN